MAYVVMEAHFSAISPRFGPGLKATQDAGSRKIAFCADNRFIV